MSLPGFETLLHRHPDDTGAISRLQHAICETLAMSSTARLDEVILSQQTQVDRAHVRDLLLELASIRALKVTLFWICPVLQGTALERSQIVDFPAVIDCDVCGQVHRFEEGRVEAYFLPDEADPPRIKSIEIRPVYSLDRPQR